MVLGFRKNHTCFEKARCPSVQLLAEQLAQMFPEAEPRRRNEEVESMIRIFVGCAGNDEDLEFQSVLHYSLEKYASEPIDLTWMRLSRDPASFWYSDPQNNKGWCTKSWATPFSALRWGIPAFCNYEGRAIYMDVDMIAKADIVELWNQKFDAPMLSKPEAICVSLYDCAKMKKVLPPLEQITQFGVYRSVRKKVTSTAGVIQRYSNNWNCLDMRRDGGGEYQSIDDPDIKVLHFTQIPTQPHLRHALPRLKREGREHWYGAKQAIHDHHRKDALALFDGLLAEAQDEGYGIERYRVSEPFGNYGR